MEDLLGGSSTPGILRYINQYVRTSTKTEAVSERTAGRPMPNPSPTPASAAHPRRHPRALGQDGDIDAPLPAAEYVERIRATMSPERCPRALPAYLGDLSGTGSRRSSPPLRHPRRSAEHVPASPVAQAQGLQGQHREQRQHP